MARIGAIGAVVFALGILTIGSAAQAHHSTAAYDRNHKVLIEGTVRKFNWTNPHSWLYVEVPDEKGGTSSWALECGSVASLINSGWTRDAVKEGSHVKIVAIISRDGTNRGEVQTLFNDDGKQLKNTIGY